VKILLQVSVHFDKTEIHLQVHNREFLDQLNKYQPLEEEAVCGKGYLKKTCSHVVLKMGEELTTLLRKNHLVRKCYT
jgi:hypothetical protein